MNYNGNMKLQWYTLVPCIFFTSFRRKIKKIKNRSKLTVETGPI